MPATPYGSQRPHSVDFRAWLIDWLPRRLLPGVASLPHLDQASAYPCETPNTALCSCMLNVIVFTSQLMFRYAMYIIASSFEDPDDVECCLDARMKIVPIVWTSQISRLPDFYGNLRSLQRRGAKSYHWRLKLKILHPFMVDRCPN